jgi:hypothetical protein
VLFCNAAKGTKAMKKTVFLSFAIALTTLANAQELAAKKLLDMLLLTPPKLESQLSDKRYYAEGAESLGDTMVKTYQYRSVSRFNKKYKPDSISRKIMLLVFKQTTKLTYQTTELTECNSMVDELKKAGFYCEYEKDSTIKPASYLYQHEDYTADVAIKKTDSTSWYAITFFKKALPVDKALHFAEDLLDFTSHEYLVYYFGTNNVKKDIYYFAGNDVVNCSVLFMNTRRQVIFIWRDGLNRRKIDNLLFGGGHKLKSQQENEDLVVENSWLLKSGAYAGMPLFDLKTLNQKNIAFCGGAAANPGLIFPESSGVVDFEKADVILGCMNCSDDKFEAAKIVYADKALQEGRILFVLTIALYPLEAGIFE